MWRDPEKETFANCSSEYRYLLQKFPISKILGVNVFLWGIMLCCTATVNNFAGIMALRVLLGCFEAIIGPAMVLITSQWYTKRMATPRYGLWYCGLGAGQIVGGLVSFGAQHGHTSFASWRIMFIAVGAFNVLVAIAVILLIPNNVDAARFLTEDEKTEIHDVLTLDQAGNGKRVFKLWSLWEAAADLQVWLLFILTILLLVPSGVVTTFSAVLIVGFGYTAKQAALLNIPSGVVSILSTLIATYAVMKTKSFPRWLGICLLLVPTIIGAGLMSFYKGSQAGVLAGIYLINCDVASLPLIYSIVGSNVQGYTKRVAANVVVAIGFSVGNIIGPQTFRGHEAPGYISAKITLFAVTSAAIIMAILLRVLYGYRNRKRVHNRTMQLEAVGRGETTLKQIEEEDLTDTTNPAFLYIY